MTFVLLLEAFVVLVATKHGLGRLPSQWLGPVHNSELGAGSAIESGAFLVLDPFDPGNSLPLPLVSNKPTI